MTLDHQFNGVVSLGSHRGGALVNSGAFEALPYAIHSLISRLHTLGLQLNIERALLDCPRSQLLDWTLLSIVGLHSIAKLYDDL